VRTLSRRLAACIVLASAAVAAPSAAAPTTHDWELSLDARALYLRDMPRFEIDAPTPTARRSVGTGWLPSTGTQPFNGLGADSAYVLDQRWQFPIFGIVVAGAIGESPRVISSVDGTIVAMKPWTSGAFSFLLPGVGVRGKSRRWLFDASVRPVATVVWMSTQYGSGEVQDGATSIIQASTLGARGHLEVCRRLDPDDRLCAFVDPHIYEFSAMNGGTIGLRWEWGR
jgi:hypothetical protein